MAEIVDTKEKYTREIRDGIEVLVYPDGTIKRADNGLFLSPPEGAKIRTSERGRELIARRYELARERAIEGIDEAAIEAGRIPKSMAGNGEGWKSVVKHVTRTLLESKNLRGQAEAANFLGKAAGLTVQDAETPENIAVAIAHLFEKFLDRLPPRADTTIEGKVIE